jgi:hypothetical protein
MDTDTIINEAVDTANVEQATPVASNEFPKPEAQENKEDTVDVSKLPDSDLTPEQLAKREANRRSHQNSKEARLRRELREAQEQVKKFQDNSTQAAVTKVQSNDGRPQEPDIGNFDNVIDWNEAKFKYLEELNDWKLEQRFSSNKQSNEETQALQQKALKLQEISNKREEFIKSTPDYTNLVSEYGEFLDTMPAFLEASFMEAEDPIGSLYVLMKEGRLFDLHDMSEKRAFAEIEKAGERFKSYSSPQKQITNAPAPITKSTRLSNSGSTSLDKMSSKELIDWINS